MSERRFISRCLEVAVGLFLGLISLVCTIGAASLVIAPPEKNPPLAIVVGLLMLLGCFWMLGKCIRLILGRPKQGGLFSPTALRVIAWTLLAMTVGGFFTGFYRQRGLTAVVQAAAYLSAFFGLRAVARSRSAGTWVDPNDPLFVEALQKARATIPIVRHLFAAGHKPMGVKYPFTTDTGGVEHVWGRLIDLGPDDMTVSIETPPVSHRGAIPKSLTVPLDALEDWHVTLPDGSMRGGFTTRAEIAIRRRNGEKIPNRVAAIEGRFID
jgi:hypothetical protein